MRIGIFFVFLLILGVGFCCQSASDTATPATTSTPIPLTPPTYTFRYLALGDSYTIGESVGEAERWCVQLAAMLRKQGISIAPPDIIARTGWTTGELANAIIASGNEQQYDLVSLLIGVNNQYRGYDKEPYRREFRALLRTATRFAQGNKGRVFVLSIPDWGVSPFANPNEKGRIATEIDAFNAIAAAECKQEGIVFIDITPLSRTALNDPSLIASDQLHFSGKMYQQWAEKSLPVVKNLFK